MQSLATGFAFALLLRQRGYLVLHASLLSRGSRAIGFIGNSGYGKSTLAEYFSQHGYQVLSDDIGALRLKGKGVIAVPGYPMVKLRRPAAEWLLGQDTSAIDMLDGRKYVSKSFDNHASVQIDRLYLLKETFDDSTEVVPLSDQQLILSLIQHTHGNHILTREDYQSRLLNQCSEVAQKVPVMLLRREKGLDRLQDVFKAVEANLPELSS